MSTSEPFELPEAELAQQQGRSQNDHPFQLGRSAAEQGQPLSSNPFTRGSHDAKMFAKGWNSLISEQANFKTLPQTEKQEEPKMSKTLRVPEKKPAIVQPDLPGTESGKPDLPQEIQEILELADEAIYQAATWKQSENAFKDKMRDLMGQHAINEVALPRGGALRYSPGKAKVSYIKPAKKKEDEGEKDEDEGDGEE